MFVWAAFLTYYFGADEERLDTPILALNIYRVRTYDAFLIRPWPADYGTMTVTETHFAPEQIKVFFNCLIHENL